MQQTHCSNNPLKGKWKRSEEVREKLRVALAKNKDFISKRNELNRLSGKEHHNWKGENITYIAIHSWLNKTFGKADCCENNKTHKGIFHYALIKGKRYERKRENFKKLCVSCHAVYDGKGNGRLRDKYGRFI